MARRQGDKGNYAIRNTQHVTQITNLNCKETIVGMPLVFNPDVAGDLAGDIQFNVSGDEPGDYFLRIADGKCTFNEGVSMVPKLTVNTPSEVWLAISRGELDGQTAFMQQKYKVDRSFPLT